MVVSMLSHDQKVIQLLLEGICSDTFSVLSSQYSHPSATQRVWMNYWLHGNYNNTTLSPGDTFNCYPAFAGAILSKEVETSPSWKRCQELSVNEIHSHRIRTVGGSLRWLNVCSLTCVFCGGFIGNTCADIRVHKSESQGTAFQFGLYRLDRKGLGGAELTPSSF